VPTRKQGDYSLPKQSWQGHLEGQTSRRVFQVAQGSGGKPQLQGGWGFWAAGA
jgi:hypothetical protein